MDDPHDLAAPYALAALDDAERHRFEAHLEGCARCRGELPGLQAAAAALALDLDSGDPAPGLRDRILTAARAEQRIDADAVPPGKRRRRPLSGVPSNRLLLGSAALAATAAAAAIGLGIWVVTLSDDLDRAQARRVDSRTLAILADPAATRYPLVGARGAVVVTPARDAALVVAGLRRAPHGRTYELWVVVRSQPRPAGTFAGGGEPSLVALTRKVPHTAQVSVSLEPAGGSPRLTGSLLFGAQTT